MTSDIRLWHYLLPCYIIAVTLTFFAPKLFVGIAFDAGGVATGPMTATFILAFTQGAANSYPNADLLADGWHDSHGCYDVDNHTADFRTCF